MRASPSSIDADAEPSEFPNRADRRFRHHRRRHPVGRSSTARRSSRARRCSPSPARSTATRSRSPIAPGWCSRRGMLATLGLARRRRAQRFRGAGAGRRGARRGAHGKDRRRRAGAERRPRRARPRHRARRRRPDPRLRPLDPGARRRRPYGHRPAHAARFRDLPASRDDRRPHFRRADPVRARPGQHLPRRRQGRRRARRASPRRPRSPRPALDETDAVAEEALALFVTCLGRTAGDLALVFKSRGGVFLTGGIAQKIVPALKTANFRAAFEDKAPHSALMRACRSMSSPTRWQRSPGLPPMRARRRVSASRRGAAAGGREPAAASGRYRRFCRRASLSALSRRRITRRASASRRPFRCLSPSPKTETAHRASERCHAPARLCPRRHHPRDDRRQCWWRDLL